MKKLKQLLLTIMTVAMAFGMIFSTKTVNAKNVELFSDCGDASSGYCGCLQVGNVIYHATPNEELIKWNTKTNKVTKLDTNVKGILYYYNNLLFYTKYGSASTAFNCINLKNGKKTRIIKGAPDNVQFYNNKMYCKVWTTKGQAVYSVDMKTLKAKRIRLIKTTLDTNISVKNKRIYYMYYKENYSTVTENSDLSGKKIKKNSFDEYIKHARINGSEIYYKWTNTTKEKAKIKLWANADSEWIYFVNSDGSTINKFVSGEEYWDAEGIKVYSTNKIKMMNVSVLGNKLFVCGYQKGKNNYGDKQVLLLMNSSGKVEKKVSFSFK